jgi:hypothetical protein
MPLFPGEMPMVAADERLNGPREHFESQTGVALAVVSFYEVPTAIFNYIVARPHTPPGPAWPPDPDRWWVFDPDLDEDQGWLPQAVFNGEGYIDYGPDGEAPRALAPFVPHPADEEDEPEVPGAGPLTAADPALDPWGRERTGETVEWTARLPRGNTSVRDALERMRDLDVRDAVYEDDKSLDNGMLGNNFVRPTRPTTGGLVMGAVGGTTSAAGQQVPRAVGASAAPGAADSVGSSPAQARAGDEAYDDQLPEEPPLRDITGRPLGNRPVAPKQKSVYEHLAQNLEDIRSSRPQPSVWERLAAQRDAKK